MAPRCPGEQSQRGSVGSVEESGARRVRQEPGGGVVRDDAGRDQHGEKGAELPGGGRGGGARGDVDEPGEAVPQAVVGGGAKLRRIGERVQQGGLGLGLDSAGNPSPRSGLPMRFARSVADVCDYWRPFAG